MRKQTSSFLVFLILCAFRLLNAWLIRTQFDPDEYWQTLEPAYCEAFPDYGCAHTWEWTRRVSPFSKPTLWNRLAEGPVRSYLSVLPTYGLYKLLRWMSWDSPFMVAKGPILLHSALVTAPTDFFVWRIASSMSADVGFWALFCSLTSWFQAYTLARPYSNSVETVVLLSGIHLVHEALFGDPMKQQRWRFAVAFILGGMSVAIRFTSMAAWVPVGVMMALRTKRRVKILAQCALFGWTGLALATLVDWRFYGFLCLPILGNFHFNVIQGLSSLYGSHPFHWYLTAGIPTMTSLILPLLLCDVVRSESNTFDRFKTTIYVISCVYTACHSISAHKEFRFLLPILPLLCIRSGFVLTDWANKVKKWRVKLIIVVFVLANALAFCYLGLFHQAAPLAVTNSIVRRVQRLDLSPSHVVRVDFLMGCHSTPLYSHLHLGNGIQIDPWHLDCPPACRSTKTCVSDRFHNDPKAFVVEAYFPGNLSNCSADEEECNATGTKAPDFLVLFAEHAHMVGDLIESMGMYAVDRFVHGINGAVILGATLGDENFDNTPFTKYDIWKDTLTISVDEMVLYEKIRLQ